MNRMANARSTRSRNGFTLVELLVVVLILAILMAVAIPLYLSAVADSQKKTCRANMQTISNAVQARKVQQQDTDYSNFIAQPINSTNEPDLQTVPTCPSGGTYSIAQGNTADNTTFAISCTQHSTFQPGLNSN